MDLTAHLAAARAAEDATLWHDAITAYEAALAEGGAGSPDEAALLTALGRCYWNLSEARTAWRTLRRAISLCHQNGDKLGQARATVEILRIWGPPERHKQFSEEALDGLGPEGDYERARILFRFRWFDEDPDVKFDEAVAIAEKRGFADLMVAKTEREGWRLMEQGHPDKAVPIFEQVHAEHARYRSYDWASGCLRGAAFDLLEMGRIDQGYEFARRAYDYSTSVNLSFSAELAICDMAGVLFARGQYDECEALLEKAPGQFDFRADCYRMWCAEARGDIDGALRLMVDPSRGGRTADGQIHAASAGVLFRAGRTDAARQAYDAWMAAPKDRDDLLMEGTAALECLLAFADDEAIRRVQESIEARDKWKTNGVYSVLQGRAYAPVRAAIALRQGRRADAERHYREGAAWCASVGFTRDAAACAEGLRALTTTGS